MNPRISGRTRRTHTTVAISAVAVITTVTLGGCGSDVDSTLSAREFRDRSNEICARSSQEISEAIGPVLGGPDPTPEQLQEALDTLVSSGRRAVVDIDALPAPASMQEDVDAMLAEFRSANDEAEAQGLGFWAGDDDPWARGNALAAEMGLDACAES